VLDVDGTWPWQEAIEEFQDTDNILFITSKSHQQPFKVKPDGQTGDAITPADYYHIIIGLEEPITNITDYKAVMLHLTKKYPVDVSCKDGGRFFFPNPNQEHFYLNTQGEL